jgi:O-antigen ligase/predicted Zn-dependent protease
MALSIFNVGSNRTFRRPSETRDSGYQTGVAGACDRLIAFAIVALVVLSPRGPIIGDERSLRIVEVIVFGASAIWAGKVLWIHASGEQPPLATQGWIKLIFPLGALLVLFAIQLIPLPPSILRVFSPNAYQVYEKSLAGWPSARPYSSSTAGSSALHLPLWRPLSLCPELTLRELVRFGCFSALIMISAFYSFGSSHREEGKFIRRTALWIMVVSTMIALWGLLSVVVPQVGDAERIRRATGPFVNPDHFANYLAMTTPLMLAGALYPRSFVKEFWRDPFRIMSAVAFLITSSAIFLSLSRAGWIIWTLSTSLLLGLTVFSRRTEQTDGDLRIGVALSLRTRIAIGGAILVLFFAGTSFLVGNQGEQLVTERASDTLAGDTGFTARAGVWKASLPMLRDFPVFGVGLDSWPEIFPHYQSAPFNRYSFWNAAHNDFLQFATETGILGVVLLVWFWWQLALYLMRARSMLPPRIVPIYAAFVTGMVVMSVHELAEFSFRITPNAVLFCLLAGFALRMARESTAAKVVFWIPSWKLPAVGMGAAVIMIVIAATRGAVAYPYDIYAAENQASRQSSAEAVPTLARLMAAHPGRADLHLEMIRSLGRAGRWSEIDHEIEAAIWLQPTNPIARDWHAYRLEQSGRVQEAFTEISRSTMLSPELETHEYLSKENLPKLSDGEKHAVEQGFQQAIDRGYPHAVTALAGFYALSARPLDEANLYLRVAGRQSAPAEQERFLIGAGEAFGEAGKTKEAESSLNQAARIAPSDSRPYVDLLSLVYRSTKDMEGAQSTVETGIGNGADPVVLYSALAETAQAANRPEIAEAALLKVLRYSPTIQNNVRLADFYLTSGKADEAVDIMRKATMIEPDSAQAYVRLAGAEEAAYLYGEADRDYSHALALEPRNAEVKSRYAEFQRRTAEKGASLNGETGK